MHNSIILRILLRLKNIQHSQSVLHTSSSFRPTLSTKHGQHKHSRYRLMRLFQYLRRMCKNKLKKKGITLGLPSCSRYLARVIYKLRLNTWNTKYSQNVTRVCKKKKILSVKHILHECPITTNLFQKNGYYFIAGNNVRDILYNTDVMNFVVKLIVHSPVGTLV